MLFVTLFHLHILSSYVTYMYGNLLGCFLKIAVDNRNI